MNEINCSSRYRHHRAVFDVLLVIAPYLRHAFCFVEWLMALFSQLVGDIDAIGVCASSRYNRSFTRSAACRRKITASSCVIGHNGTSFTCTKCENETNFKRALSFEGMKMTGTDKLNAA